MPKHILTLVAIVVFNVSLPAQNLSDIFTAVDTLYMPGAAPGNLLSSQPELTPIVSSSPCETPQLDYAMATEYESGRVIAIAHESLLSDGSIDFNDNLEFVIKALAWLNPGNKRIALKEGWISAGNSSRLQSALADQDYSFNTLNGDITSTALANTDILIFGNDWNGVQPYTTTELSAIDGFVANGGAVFIAGLGWSWPEGLSQYPMNQVAQLFGFEYGTSVIRDPAFNIDGAPKLYHFFPANLNTTQSPYCPSPFLGTNLARGEHLRVLRIAVSTTGAFTQQNGGVNATSLLVEEWLAKINELYGREYCVRFELIPNNNLVLFPDPATDPWATLPPGSGGCTNADLILSQQFEVFNNVIGTANYDISHVIAGSSFGGGCASGLQTGLSGGLDIPVTRHEIGHQLAQSHTINNSGNNNYEPENGGWTIQGGNAQGYGHAVSFHQLAHFLRNGIPLVGEKVPTGNTIPSVDAGPDVVIPKSTPFTLTGMGTDSDPNDSLTYVWDNMNRGIAQRIPVADDTQGALFMRLLPDTSASRTFPRMSDVIANRDANEQEQLPTQPRILDIRLTVNDHHQMVYQGEVINASGVHSDDVQVVVTDAGPFRVTSQNVPDIIYTGGAEQTVSWSVNGTDAPPINTQSVEISLSTDGGYTYPIVLLERTENDGSATVRMPNINTEQARIKVAAIDNIYFDLNTQNFKIKQDVTTSTNELKPFVVKIYPNPAQGYIQMEVPYKRNFRAQLYDTNGKELVSQTNNSYFDISTFSDGTYLMILTDMDTDEKISKKIVVVK